MHLVTLHKSLEKARIVGAEKKLRRRSWKVNWVVVNARPSSTEPGGFLPLGLQNHGNNFDLPADDTWSFHIAG